MNEENTVPNIWNDIARRALRTGAHIPVVEEEFNREKALMGLAHNFQFNRRPKFTVIRNFRKIIEDGSFALGSTIRIARNEAGEWVLVDGQHRLDAIAQSNAKIWMMVAVDERPANIAYSSIDNVGTLRTHADAISSILGWSTSHWNSITGAARLIASGFNKEEFKFRGLHSKVNNDETARVAASMRDEISRILEITKKGKVTNARRAPAICVFLVAAKYSPEIFYPWFERAIKDDMLPRDSTEKRLSETFLWQAHVDESRLRLFAATALIWNAQYRGESMAAIPRIVVSGERQTKWPDILGTPYAK